MVPACVLVYFERVNLKSLEGGSAGALKNFEWSVFGLSGESVDQATD